MIESIANMTVEIPVLCFCAGLSLSTALGDVHSASIFLYIKANGPKHWYMGA